MKYVLGSRGSELALKQSEHVAAALQQRSPDAEFEVVVIRTQGDEKQGTPRARQSDKKDWISELEVAVLEGRIDMAVHSAKDIPSDFHTETRITSVLQRYSPFDAFIGAIQADGSRLPFRALAEEAVVGTASLRRQSCLLEQKPRLQVREHRGNVPTRLRKLDESESLSGIVVAACGLERLAIDVGQEILSAQDILPAVNQGILAVQYAADRSEMAALCDPLVHEATQQRFLAERSCAETLGGDCHSAIGIYAEHRGEVLLLQAKVLSHDGQTTIASRQSASAQDAVALGVAVARELIAQGAEALLQLGTSDICAE